MNDSPQIPFGYKRVDPYAPTQKGDGLWDGTRFRKVRKEYPFLGERIGVAIRRCTVEQLPLDQPCQNPGCPHTIVDHSEEKCGTCGHGIKGEEFEA